MTEAGTVAAEGLGLAEAMSPAISERLEEPLAGHLWAALVVD